MGLIVLSVGTFIAETMPDYKDDLKKVKIPDARFLSHLLFIHLTIFYIFHHTLTFITIYIVFMATNTI